MEANNNAKLREALKELMDNLKIHAMMPCQQITMNHAEVDAMIEDCRAALAEPPRNCDLYNTADEARAAWICLNIGVIKRYSDFEDWLFAKAEGGAGGDSANEAKPEIVEVPRLLPCPNCGKDTAWIVHPAFDGGAKVACSECHYDPQVETWDETDAGSAIKWNNLKREGGAK